MCRSIKPLYNLNPRATETEIREASLQFVRKVSGFRKPSKTNEQIFDKAVSDIARDVRLLLGELTTVANPRQRLKKEAHH